MRRDCPKVSSTELTCSWGSKPSCGGIQHSRRRARSSWKMLVRLWFFASLSSRKTAPGHVRLPVPSCFWPSFRWRWTALTQSPQTVHGPLTFTPGLDKSSLCKRRSRNVQLWHRASCLQERLVSWIALLLFFWAPSTPCLMTCCPRRRISKAVSLAWTTCWCIWSFDFTKVLLLFRFETEACELNKCPLVLLAFA